MNSLPPEMRCPPLQQQFASRAAQLLVLGEAGEVVEGLEKALFDCLRLRNGTYKTTYPHRLDDVNAWIGAALPTTRPLKIMDVAISSGTSTLEWVQSLEAAGVDHHMTAMDLTIDGFLVSFGDRFHVVLDRTKWPLMFEVDGEFVSNPPRKKHVLRHFFRLARIKLALRAWKKQYSGSRSVPLTLFGMRTITSNVHLVTPRLRHHPRVMIYEGDLLSGSGIHGTYHIIRAANILNRQYFDESMLRKIVCNLKAHLAPDGALAVCRTELDGNHGTIFKVGGDHRLVPISRLNKGSEAEQAILESQSV
jgi:hypothetical protein